MRRLFLLPALVLAVGAWLGFSENGLSALARLAGAASGDRLTVEQPSGRLVGPLGFGRLSWKEPGLGVVVDDLRIDWTPGALFEQRLAIGELAAARLRIDIASSDEATPPPASLTLPVAVDIQKMLISRLDYGQVFSAGDLRGVFASDGMTHRLSDFGARGCVAVVIAGSAELGGSAPLPLRVNASIAGKLDDHAVRLAVSADGPLERIEVKVTAEQGVSGSGRALFTPFARQPFAEARLELADVDPAAWIDGAPAARLTLQADVRPDERQADAIAGQLRAAQRQRRPARPPAPAARANERPLYLE